MPSMTMCVASIRLCFLFLFDDILTMTNTAVVKAFQVVVAEFNAVLQRSSILLLEKERQTKQEYNETFISQTIVHRRRGTYQAFRVILKEIKASGHFTRETQTGRHLSFTV